MEEKRFNLATEQVEQVEQANPDDDESAEAQRAARKPLPSCWTEAQLAVALAAVLLGVAQLALAPQTWPSRQASSSWLLCAVGPAAWTSACYTNRVSPLALQHAARMQHSAPPTAVHWRAAHLSRRCDQVVSAVSFLAVSLAAIALLLSWSAIGPASAICDSTWVPAGQSGDGSAIPHPPTLPCAGSHQSVSNASRLLGVRAAQGAKRAPACRNAATDAAAAPSPPTRPPASGSTPASRGCS